MQSLPQLETNTFSGQIFWLFISFLILYFFISKAFLPKIFDIVSQRENYFNNIKENIINLKEKILKIKNSNKDILEKSKLQVNSILKDSKEQKDELKKNFDLQKDLVLKENNAQFMIDIKNDFDFNRQNIFHNYMQINKIFSFKLLESKEDILSQIDELKIKEIFNKNLKLFEENNL